MTMQKKMMMDMRVIVCAKLHGPYSLLKLTPVSGEKLPEMMPGQFVQVAVPGAPHTMLRRPISVNYVEPECNLLWMLVRKAGEGTEILASLDEGSRVNLLLPLGNGFSMPEAGKRLMLIGGGVGVAPLLYFGKKLREEGHTPRFLLGARSKDDLLELEEFRRLGEVYVSTDDGSDGEPGVVTQNSVLRSGIDNIYCCGPAPMMKAVARVAGEIGAECEVSLENMMACGLGACLCCVEKTVKGNVCVCTEGPVFNINQLTWQI